MDLNYKLLISKDVSPNDLATVALAVDSIDLLLSMKQIYDDDYKKNRIVKKENYVSIALNDNNRLIIKPIYQ